MKEAGENLEKIIKCVPSFFHTSEDLVPALCNRAVCSPARGPPGTSAGQVLREWPGAGALSAWAPVSLSCPRLRSLEKATHSHKLKWEVPLRDGGGGEHEARRLYILTLTFYRWETQAQRDRAARAKEGTLGWEEAEIWDLGRMAMYSLMTLGK